MRGVFKKFSQFILVFTLTISWILFGLPLEASFTEVATSTLLQQTATTTPEIIPQSAIEIATTSATTTEEVIELTLESPQTGEVLGATTEETMINDEEPDEDEESIEEEEVYFVEEKIEEQIKEIEVIEPRPPTSPLPSLSMRRLERKIMVSKSADHACEAETFRIDIFGKKLSQTRIMLQRDTDEPYEIEIGGLPNGIDITFEKNNAYKYVQGAGDRYLSLLIHNQTGSQKGDFSIPIVYTQKGAKDSSVICQLNIVNQ